LLCERVKAALLSYEPAVDVPEKDLRRIRDLALEVTWPAG
jgi:hypothetical protein